jgi:hypothetical protein
MDTPEMVWQQTADAKRHEQCMIMTTGPFDDDDRKVTHAKAA